MEAAARRLAALARHTSPLPCHTGAGGVGEGAEAGWHPSTIFDEGNAITGGYYGHKGLLSPLPAVQAELDRLSTAQLAAASVPRCLQGEDLPVLWGREEWVAVERRQREPLFDMVALREQLAAADFEREGVAVLRGVMTPETTRRWTEALQRCRAPHHPTPPTPLTRSELTEPCACRGPQRPRDLLRLARVHRLGGAPHPCPHRGPHAPAEGGRARRRAAPPPDERSQRRACDAAARHAAGILPAGQRAVPDGADVPPAAG